jgi:hypothetical protein
MRAARESASQPPPPPPPPPPARHPVSCAQISPPALQRCRSMEDRGSRNKTLFRTNSEPAVFPPYQTPTSAERLEASAVIEPRRGYGAEVSAAHPCNGGLFARLDEGGMLRLLLPDSSKSPSTPRSARITPKNSEPLLWAHTTKVSEAEELLRPSLCWAPSLGQNVVLTCSDGRTVERWQATRSLDCITRKAVNSPYDDDCMTGMIHSISCCSGGEYCLVADELRIFVWKLEDMDGQQPLVALDITPPVRRELLEVITCACFHPTECGTVVVGYDTGRVAFFDASMTKHWGVAVRELEPLGRDDDYRNSALEEYTKPVSSLKFSVDGEKILVRDLGTVRVYEGATASQENLPLDVQHIQGFPLEEDDLEMMHDDGTLGRSYGIDVREGSEGDIEFHAVLPCGGLHVDVVMAHRLSSSGVD